MSGEQIVGLCEHCKQAIGEGHEQADSCLVYPGENLFKLTNGDMRRYKPEHRELVLKHGVQKFGFAFNVWTSNLCFNHLLNSAGKFMHLRAPSQRLLNNYDWVLTQALEAHQFRLAEDIMPLVEELARASDQAAPRLVIIGKDGHPKV